MIDSIATRTQRSTRFTLASTFATGLLQLVSLVILARLLVPADYGTFAITLSLTAITLQVFLSALESAVVTSDDSDAISSYFLPVMAISIFACALPFSCYALVYALGLKGASLSVMGVLVAAHLMASIAIVPRAMLRRELQFGRIVSGEFIGQCAGQFGTTILLAALGFGPLAMAFGMLVTSTVSSAVIVAKHRTVISRWQWCGVQALLKRFRSIISIVIVEMASTQSPALIFGYAFGQSSAGLFNRGTAIIGLPLQLLTNSITRVLMSSFLSLANQREQLALEFLRQVRIISACVFPVAAGIAASADSFTDIVLGENWTSAKALVPPIAIFSSVSMVRILVGTLADGLQAFQSKLVIQCSGLAMTVCVLIGLANFGMQVALYGLAIVAIVHLILLLKLGSRLTGLSPYLLIQAFIPSLLAACGTALAAYTAGLVMGGGAAPLVLIVQVLTCSAAALIILRAADFTTFKVIARLTGVGVLWNKIKNKIFY